MAQIINTNIASLNAQRNLNQSQSALSTSLQRLSSGLRINSAKDDAAGLAISSRMSAQINGLNQAARNANDGISLAQTAEGALGGISDNLQRMRTLAVQAANGTNSASDRSAIQAEMTQLTQEIDRVANTTQFNGTQLLDGSLVNSSFQIGANSGQTISMSLNSAKSNSLGLAGAGQAGVTSAATAAGGTATAYNLTGTLTVTTTNTVAGTSNVATIAAATNDGISYVGGVQSGATSALAAANAINSQAGTTGITAQATTAYNAAAVSTVTATGGFAAGTVKINGVDIGAVGPSATASTQTSAIAAAINNVSGQTGVTATVNAAGTGLSLNAADGRNIDMITTAIGSTTGLSAAAATTTQYGQVTMATSSANTTFTVAGQTASWGLGASASSTLSSSSGGVSVLTQSGASAAIVNLDNALQIINSQRALLGAVQNRFTSVVNTLQSTAENLSASRSRIQDTDFAAETASLTRGQILQQAGTAMLAQANSLPNGVMALLR
jgi:flagellin